MRMQWTVLAALVFALIITLFALANMNPVPVSYWFGYDANLPLIMVILLSALLGGLSIGSIGIIRQFRLQRHIRRLERQLAERQKDSQLGTEQEPVTTDSVDSDDVTSHQAEHTEEPQASPRQQKQQES